MNTEIFAFFLLFIDAALAAPNTRTAFNQTWEKQLAAYAKKMDIIGFGQYRTGLLDRNEMILRTTNMFDDAAFRSIANCSHAASSEANTFKCDLTIPVIDKIVATTKLSISRELATLELIINDVIIMLSNTTTAEFFYDDIDAPIANYLTTFGPPEVRNMSDLLLANIVVNATDMGDGFTSQVCITFEVGMQGSSGEEIPNMPLPKNMPLLCKIIALPPQQLGTFEKILQAAANGIRLARLFGLL